MEEIVASLLVLPATYAALALYKARWGGLWQY
jgi:hypothetical protein